VKINEQKWNFSPRSMPVVEAFIRAKLFTEGDLFVASSRSGHFGTEKFR
jgi:hypothetical protein